MTIKLHPSIRVHPGEFLLREFVEPYGLTISSTAKKLRVHRVSMSKLLNGKASLTPEMARRFEAAFGVSAATLVRMQGSYDLAQIELAGEELEIERIPEPA